MSILESLAEFIAGGPPTWVCADCGGPVPGNDCGAIEVNGGRVWCRPCAAVLPEDDNAPLPSGRSGGRSGRSGRLPEPDTDTSSEPWADAFFAVLRSLFGRH